jgi:pimeloyl-ACP methyl ester carboxylesterase
MRTLTADNQGIQIAYQRFGSADNPLLLIMGIGADMHYWHDDFCIALLDRGFEVVRLDNRDSGGSTHLDWAGTPNTPSCATTRRPRRIGLRTWPTMRSGSSMR